MGRWQLWGILLLWAVNLGLRLWQIGSPTALVFDEVHYVTFAVDYLQHRPFFDVHPPLGKYLIALSIHLSTIWGPAPDPPITPQITVAGMALTPYSYRWLNALLGSLMPVAALWVAWIWSEGIPLVRRRWFAAMAGLLTSMDGFSLVESRLGLLHPPLILLGLVALGAWGRSRFALHPWRWQLLAGVALGGAIAVKWNGAGYLLALVLNEVLTRHRWHHRPRPWLWLGLLPLGVYSLMWIPHLQLVGTGFWELHRTLLAAHLGFAATHEYQSVWLTWPLMIRPIAYFYQGLGPGETVNMLGPTIPAPDRAVALYGFGNPILWWLSTAAVVMMGMAQGASSAWPRRRSLATIAATLHQGQRLPPLRHATIQAAQAPQQFLLVAYLAHWVPWALVRRSTFLYHYQPAALMAVLILVWQLSGWLTSRRRSWHYWGWGMLALIAISFGFWLPLWVGWPLSVQGLEWRWWLPSWM
jgi:dolichyl-phosphate-mannose-protein mannosyltransferase